MMTHDCYNFLFEEQNIESYMGTEVLIQFDKKNTFGNHEDLYYSTNPLIVL